MASPIEVKFSVRGFADVQNAFNEVERRAKHASGALAGTIHETERAGRGVRSGLRDVGQGLQAVRTAVGGLADAASVINPSVAGPLQDVANTAGTAATAVSVLRGGLMALQSAGPVILAISAALATVAALKGKIEEASGLTALRETDAAEKRRLETVTAHVALARTRLQIAKEEFEQGRASQGAVDAARHNLELMLRLQVSVTEQVATRLGLHGKELEVAQQQADIQLQLIQMSKEQAKPFDISALIDRINQVRERQLAYIATVESTTARLALQREVVQQTVTSFELLRDRVAQTSQQKQQIQGIIEGLKTSLIGLNDQLERADQAYSRLVRRAFELQRAGERDLPTGQIAALIAAYRQERDAAEEARLAEEAVADSRRRLISDTQAYQDAIREATAAEEDWNRQLDFDRRQMGEQEATIQRQIDAHRRRLELMDEGIEKRRAEQASLQQLIAAIHAEIAALNEEIQAKIAAGIPVEALVQGQERLSAILAQLRHEYELSGKAVRAALMRPILEVIAASERAFEDFFADVLTGAKSFGDTLLGFFRSIVNSIITALARLAASWIVRWLFGMFSPMGPVTLGFPTATLARGGIIPGALMQHGGIVNRPTLAMVGEGRSSEAVVPLPDNRSIPVTFTGRDREERPQEIVVRTTVVMDPRQIPPPQADEITNVVLMDIRSGGAVYREIRRAVGR